MALEIGYVRGIPIIQDSSAPGVPVVDVTRDGGDLIAALAAKALQNQDRSVDCRDFGAVGDNSADDTAAIQAAIEHVYARGGGNVRVQDGVYAISDELELPERVLISGGGSPGWELSGTVPNNSSIAVIPDSTLAGDNTKGAIRIIYRGSSDVVGRRQNGGVRDINIYGGYASGDPSPPLNHGILVAGTRFVEITRVHLVRCGGNGLYCITDTASPNGLQLHACFAGFNGNHGFAIGGGDSVVTHCIAGTNTLDGFSNTCGGISYTDCLAWNNIRDGFSEGGISQGVIYSACVSYDNEKNGFAAQAGSANVSWIGCQAFDNGRNLSGQYASATDRAGFWFAAGGNYDTCQIVGGISGGRFVTTQEYGVSMRSTTGALDITGLRCNGNHTANHFIAGGTFRSRPFSDNQILLGDSTFRLARVTSADFRVHAAVSAAQPVIGISSSGITFGAGGSTAVDVNLLRTTANQLDLANGDSFKMEGTWNGGHLLLGANHIWVDATGDLRIKSSAPSSDTDGTVIGTQS